jgi:hypothetical protein
MTDEGVNSVENRCKGPIILSQLFPFHQPFIGRHRGKTVISYPSPRHRILHSDGAASPLAGEKGRLPVGRGERLGRTG